MSMTLSLRVLARLLGYPGAELRGHLPEMRDALRAERAVSDARLAELDLLMDALARVAVHVLEQVQRGGASAIEQLHVGGLGVERIGARERIHQQVQFRQARIADGALGAQRFAQRGQVGA